MFFTWSHDRHINIITLMTSTSSIHHKHFWQFFLSHFRGEASSLMSRLIFSYTQIKKNISLENSALNLPSAQIHISHISQFHSAHVYVMIRFCPFPTHCNVSVFSWKSVKCPLISGLNARLLLVAFLSFGAWKDTKAALFCCTAQSNLPPVTSLIQITNTSQSYTINCSETGILKILNIMMKLCSH